jgi:hypothetical protein
MGGGMQGENTSMPSTLKSQELLVGMSTMPAGAVDTFVVSAMGTLMREKNKLIKINFFKNFNFLITL